MLGTFHIYDSSLDNLAIDEKLLINTINAHSYNVARHDDLFLKSLQNSDVLIPDGVGVTKAIKLLSGHSLKKIAGADLFFYEMNRLNAMGGKCFFLGSTERVLGNIREVASLDYPNVEVATYSPPYKPSFSEEDNAKMIAEVNAFKPDVLFVGMTAPKQEKWASEHFDRLDAGHIGCIGAVFDFYARTINRAPAWMIKHSLEWSYRFVKEPRRMFKRYVIGNGRFIWAIHREKLRKHRFAVHIRKEVERQMKNVPRN